MIIKQRSKPIKMIVCEALSRRLPPTHSKLSIIKDDFAMESSGYKGEQSLDYHLNALSEKRYQILHDLRLSNGQYYFQIDTILFSLNFGLILEVKNYTGNLFLDSDFNQLIQEKNGIQRGFPDPVLQVARQQWELQRWLQSHRFSEIPLHSLVVFTNRNCILSTTAGNKQIYQKVCKPGDIFKRVNHLEELFCAEKFCKKTLGKLTRLLVKNHTPRTNSSILSQYNINRSEIATGVQCPNCFKNPMQYHNGLWICSACRLRSKNAHEQAIYDYFLLIKPTITNSELRKFLHLPQEKAAQRILKSSNLPFSGEKKARVYYALDNQLTF